MSNIVLALWHSIEEFDQVRLLHSIGHNVFSIGAYIDPANPGDDKRPALPEVPAIPELRKAVDRTVAEGVEPKAALPPEVLDWADIIIYHHHLPDLFAQWEERIAPWLAAKRHRRIIWRTVGQSVTSNELEALPFRGRGLEIVRYSPKERNIPGYIGEDALIRFYKDPDEWNGWIGDEAVVTNVTQDMRRRDEWCNYAFWGMATDGLPVRPMGPGSEVIGGTGPLPWEEMREGLRHARVYLYTGTQPASYTLGLIEAMMVGVPTISIGPSWMRIFPYGPELFEAHEIVDCWAEGSKATRWDNPQTVRADLELYLGDREYAARWGATCRHSAIEFFGRKTIARQWADFLR